jgi:hypothetical protein
VTPNTNEDDVTISVKRTINGSDALYVEKMGSRILSSLAAGFYVDSGITESSETVYYDGAVVYDGSDVVVYDDDYETDEIHGLTHLIGEKVAVLADGVVIYDGTEDASEVDSSGICTLPAAANYSVIHAGLPYTALVQPMRIVATSQQGTTLMENTRIADMKISFLNTLGAEYGNDEDDLYTIDFDDERLEDEAYITGLFSGDVPVVMDGGISRQNPIYVTNDQPLPMTVRSIVVGFEETGR